MAGDSCRHGLSIMIVDLIEMKGRRFAGAASHARTRTGAGTGDAGGLAELNSPGRGAIMLTKKAKYGLKAMLHLAQLDFGRSVFVADIAERNAIPKKFLDTILSELKSAGLLSSKKGRNGGYTLAEHPEHIKIGTIIRVLDGPLAPIPCASRSSYQPCSDCETVETCRIRMIMLEVREAIAGVLDHMTLAEVRDIPHDRMIDFV